MAAPKEVVVTGVDIPFFSMVWIILKWTLASIPMWMLGALLFALGGGIIAAILAAAGVAAEGGV